VHQFSNGPLGALLPYLVSCIGSALGLQCMIRARSSVSGSRFWWLTLSSLAIGGTGIWGMHFIAMLGFRVTGVPITYTVPITLASMAVSIAVVSIGLTIAVRGAGRGRALLLGGAITGLGVAAMHYMGMAAMKMPAPVTYNYAIVAASVVIGVVAATAALWFTMNVRGFWATVVAALVMGVAVCGMHYTGMLALRVGPMDAAMAAQGTVGVTTSQLLAPLIIGLGATTLLMIFLVVLAPSEQELHSEAELNRNLEAIRTGQHRTTERV
jgi:NO-binding membrane sensor protein with MHYT domain